MNQLKIKQQRVNVDKIVTGKDLDLERHEAKFKAWDYVVEHKILEKGTEQEKSMAIRMLNDDTVYAYAFLKDEDGEPFKYTAYQDLIAEVACRHDFTPDNPNRYILFKASNQIGKSRWLIGRALKIMFTEENRNVVIVSRSLPQSQFLLANMRLALNNSAFRDSWREAVGETANTTMMTFEKKTGDKTIVNRIICAPAGEGTLGYPVHYLFLDEADFYEESQVFFWKVAFARTKKTKGQIILFSNPNPEIARANSLLWELWNKKDLFKRRFTFNFLDAPWNTKEEYERDKREAPSYIFASTHGGEFPEEGGAFFTISEINDMVCKDWLNTLPTSDKPVFIALDLGKMRDQTILSIGIVKKSKFEDDKYNDLEVRYTEEFKLKTSYDLIAKRLREIKEYYEENYAGVAAIGFDATGQKTFGDFLKRMGVQAIEVDFSRKETNKTRLYNDFKLLAENRKIKVVYNRKCEQQLHGLEFKLTEGKKLKKVEAKTVSIHDDYPDSLVILIHIAIRMSGAPVSVTIANKPESEDELDDGFKEIWKDMGLVDDNDEPFMSHFDDRRYKNGVLRYG